MHRQQFKRISPIDERLKADTFFTDTLGLSQLLLMNDKSLPWLILVPERSGVKEIFELSQKDRLRLMEEIAEVSGLIQRRYLPDKINIGALGHVVPQLQVLVIGRFKTDRAWPGPIWGTGPVRPYTPEEAEAVCRRLALELKPSF